MNKEWIEKAVNNKGSLRKALKIKKGDKIPEKTVEKAAHSKNKLLGKRARLAETLATLRKRK